MGNSILNISCWCTSRCVQKSKFFWSLPWCGSDSLVSWPSICLEITRIRPFITPLKRYIRNSLDTLKAEENWEQRNYSPLFLELVLESVSLCPLEHFGVLPKLAFCLWACYWEMEAQVGDSFSSIPRRANRGCIHCNLWFYINRNIFSCPIMYIWMSIVSMGCFQMLIHCWLYMRDYI